MQNPSRMSEPSEPTLESLRAEGAHHHDPTRLYYLEALARRLEGQPAAVQQVLRGRLREALVAYAGRRQLIFGEGPRPPRPAAPAAGAALARLTRELNARAQAEARTELASDGARLSDLKSVRQFSEVWSKISAEQQVVQALHRGPDNAGPLNSHRLMLRSLSLMQSLSPDYLRRFLSQTDSLLWLEQASTKRNGSTAKPVRKSRSKR